MISTLEFPQLQKSPTAIWSQWRSELQLWIFFCMLNVGGLIGKCVYLINQSPLLHILIASTSRALLPLPFFSFFFSGGHIGLLRSPLIFISLLLLSWTLRDYLFIPSLPLVFFFFLSPIFLGRPFYHPSPCCDWHFIRRVEVLSLDLYCDTVARVAFINLFLPARHNRCHSRCMLAGNILVHDFQQHLYVNVGWHEYSHIWCAFLKKCNLIKTIFSCLTCTCFRYR